MGSVANENDTPKEAELEGFIINKVLLELILEKDVEDFKVRIGSNPGDNYMSIMHAVEVHFKDNDKPEHLVIKCYPNQQGRREFLDTTDVFGKEFFFYSEWAPKLMGLDPNVPVAVPEFLGGSCKGVGRTRSKKIIYPEPWTKENFIVMSDLRKNKGLSMASRMDGLDIDHTLLVLKELATLHALSWGYREKQGIDKLSTIYPELIDKMYAEDEFRVQFKPLMDSITTSTLKTVEDALGPTNPIFLAVKKLYSLDEMEIMAKSVSAGELDEKYFESLLRVQNDSLEDFVEEQWLVGCHGDSWVNNMLFGYDPQDPQKPNQVVLLDYQLYREACLTSDLAYFLFTSTDLATRKPNEGLMLKTYYDQIMLVWGQLGCRPLPGFTLKALTRKLRRAKIYGFLIAMPLLTVVLKPPEESIDIDTISGDITDVFGSVMQGGSKNTLLRDRILELATDFYESGII